MPNSEHRDLRAFFISACAANPHRVRAGLRKTEERRAADILPPDAPPPDVRPAPPPRRGGL